MLKNYEKKQNLSQSYYIKIKDGKIKLLEKKDEKWVLSENSYDFVEGFLTYLNLDDGKFGKELIIGLTSNEGVYYLNIPFTFGYCFDFLERTDQLIQLDKNKDFYLRLQPVEFKNEDYTNKYLVISYFDKNKGDFIKIDRYKERPKPNIVLVNGKEIKDFTAYIKDLSGNLGMVKNYAAEISKKINELLINLK